MHLCEDVFLCILRVGFDTLGDQFVALLSLFSVSQSVSGHLLCGQDGLCLTSELLEGVTRVLDMITQSRSLLSWHEDREFQERPGGLHDPVSQPSRGRGALSLAVSL